MYVCLLALIPPSGVWIYDIGFYERPAESRQRPPWNCYIVGGIDDTPP